MSLATEFSAEPPVSIGGLQVRCFGAAGNPAVLLSPGLGGLGSYWTPQVRALAADYRVVLYDHRGTGGSERQLPTPYTAGHLADDIEAVMDGLGLASAHLVGHAAGGIAALALADRAAPRVRSLTLVNAWARSSAYFRRCFEVRLGILRAGGPLAYLTAQPLFLYPASWISEHLDELDAQAREHAAEFQDEAVLEARIGALIAFDLSARLHAIETPTLVVSASDDMLVPSEASIALSTGLPRATLHVEPWGGHAVNITRPEAFNRTLAAFLASLHSSAKD